MPFSNPVLFHNSLRTWCEALALALAGFTGLWFFQHLVLRRLSRFTERTRTPMDQVILAGLRNTRFISAFCLAIFFASRHLTIPAATQGHLRTLVLLALLLHGGFWVRSTISHLLNRAIEARAGNDPAAAITLRRLAVLAKVILWGTLLLLMLATLGVNIPGLMAGLGVGGLAVALAMQKILGDLFASLSIIMDKPFEVGDFIIVGNVKGLVQHIGLKTTRVRSTSGEQVVFSNSDLLQSRIQNCQRIEDRKVRLTLRLALDTPYLKLCAVPDLIRGVILSQPGLRFRNCYFKEIGVSALEFGVSYAIRDTDYDVFQRAQHQVHLELLRAFQEHGLALAYPTQTLHHQHLEEVLRVRPNEPPPVPPAAATGPEPEPEPEP